MYDGDGNRVSKTVGGVTTCYLVDDRNPSGYPQVMEEYYIINVNYQFELLLNRVYNYGLALISQQQFNTNSYLPSTLFYYGYDGHGSVRFLTDTNGSITDTYTYDAYGTLISKTFTGSQPAPNNYLYAGQQYDPDLGLYYNRARYLNPNAGRFWTMDTFAGNNEDPLSLHKYLYCHDNPVNGIDPSGHDDIAMAIDFGIIGVLASMPNLVTIGEATAAILPGTWNVREHEIDLNQPGISIHAYGNASPQGFWVTYKPNPAESKDDQIVVYQIISATGAAGFSAHVDNGNGRAPTTGSPLPPAMRPIADSQTSYQDSPTYPSGFFGVMTFRLTSVAVNRTKDERGGDHLLSTYYFEFSNSTRNITKRDPDYKTHYDDGMKYRWGN